MMDTKVGQGALTVRLIHIDNRKDIEMPSSKNDASRVNNPGVVEAEDPAKGPQKTLDDDAERRRAARSGQRPNDAGARGSSHVT